MNNDRTLERAARSWIEAGPTRAPQHVVEAALRQIESTHQERDLRVPRRLRTMLTPARVAVAAAVGALAIGASLLLRGPAATVGDRPSVSPSPSSAAITASPRPTPNDYSSLPGLILAEHLGNAFDGSDPPTDDLNPDRRRFYLLDPADPTYDAAMEFLPGQPEGGKSAADVSPDGQRVVFHSWTAPPQLYEANLDGTGLRRLPNPGNRALVYPDYDPTGTRIVFVHIDVEESWLEILDLETEVATPIESTRGPADNSVPEQPAWSPDGTMIAFSRLQWPEEHEPGVGTVHYGDVPPVSGVLSILDVATGTVRDLDLPPGLLPGDVDWSPDSASLVFSHAPASTTGSVADMPRPQVYRVDTDGDNLQELPGWGGPRYTPDGEHILVQDDVFFLMRPDGTDLRPLNSQASDLSSGPAGFIYIGHWIDTP